MAGRPIKNRTTKSYQRDVESITRLRTAIQFDARIPIEKRKNAIKVLDVTIDTLAGISGAIAEV